MKAYWLGSAKVYNADEVGAEIERLCEQLNEHRATIFAKEAEAQKWANECERLRAVIVRWDETGKAAAANPQDYDLEADHVAAEGALIQIAREGR